MSFNKSFLLGYIGQTPTIKSTDKYAVCSFSVATSDVWFDKDKKRNTSTEWHNIKAWGKLAEICSEHLSQGDQIFIEGQNCTDIKENSDGTKSYYKYIKLKDIRFIKVKKFTELSKNSVNDVNKDNQNSNDLLASSHFDYSVESEFIADQIPF